MPGAQGRVPRLLSRTAAIALAAGVLVAASGCSGGGAPADDKPDNGTKLTLWVRSATDALSNGLADAYNKTHKNQVKVTVIPNDNYLQKVGASAGSNSLPDLLASDVVYTPQYVDNGLLQDITKQVKSLSFASSLAQAHVKAATKDGKIYGVPHKLDSSILIYNKDLFKKAGLDPDQPPKNFDDIYKDSKAIRALGGSTYGFYFAGSCGGCGVYTLFPFAVAGGHQPLVDGGKKADIDNPAMKATFALYKKLYDEGIVPSSAKADDGTNWQTLFEQGKIGMMPYGSFAFAGFKKTVKFDWGVSPLMAPDGSATSTFVGGDTIGISKSSKHFAQAWDFVKWTLGDEAQVEVVSKSGELTSRLDLAKNKYTNSDQRVTSTIAGLSNGFTPVTLPFGDVFNNPNGVWVETLRKAIFGSDIDGALGDGQKKIQSAIDDAY